MKKLTLKWLLFYVVSMVIIFPSIAKGTTENFDHEMIELKTSNHVEEVLPELVKANEMTKGRFTDLKPGETGYNEVLELVEQGIITGYSDGSFKPYANITRQHFAVMLYRALNLQPPEEIDRVLAKVSDVSPNHDYAIEIATMMEAGIIQGAKGKVNPNANITRGQMASMLVRSFNLKDDGSQVNLVDLDRIDSAHRNNVKIIAQHEITSGKLNKNNERYFAADDYLNRVQFAILFYRTLELAEFIDPIEYELNEFEREVVYLTNEQRKKHGLSPLKIDEKLSAVAKEKSKDMVENNYFDHNSPVYGSPFEMMELYGISYLAAGENIASGFHTPVAVVAAWMDSPDHRKNILNNRYTHIGVGFAREENIWTQQFIRK